MNRCIQLIVHWTSQQISIDGCQLVLDSAPRPEINYVPTVSLVLAGDSPQASIPPGATASPLGDEWTIVVYPKAA